MQQLNDLNTISLYINILILGIFRFKITPLFRLFGRTKINEIWRPLSDTIFNNTDSELWSNEVKCNDRLTEKHYHNKCKLSLYIYFFYHKHF